MAKATHTFFSWEAPEFLHYEKNIGWYLTLIILTGLLVGYEVFQKDYFGAISLAILAFFIVAFSHQKPRTITVELSNVGINVSNHHIPYKHINRFWVVQTDHHKTLNLETSAYIHQTMIIQLANQDAEEIREFLMKIIPEHENPGPTLIQQVMHRLKF